ncbi:hypothetical protein DYB32_002543 [Aphanomyces invadans]|uniref:Uncharacterized protein n=1 Tax=Aphanomyces invadans TaxID=157072 RepID=A0A3R6VQB3_9STRA|nr:hypothetical protein DYB32_002543 [Aphanomyces invadans]
MKKLKSRSKHSFRSGSSNLEAAILAAAVHDNENDEHPHDGKTFAASYWKQQVLASKRKLSAVVDRHTRDIYDLHHKLRRTPDVALPQLDLLDRARDATLRQIVHIDRLLDKADARALNVPTSLHAHVVEHIGDLLARCRVAQAHVGKVWMAWEDADVGLPRRSTDLKHFLRFLETKHAVTKLANRFAHRMELLKHTHRSAILRRMHQILMPPPPPVASLDSTPVVKANTSTPPKFLLQEHAMDLEIAALKTKLGIEQPTVSSSPEDLLLQLRRDFGTLFSRHVAPYQSDAIIRKDAPTRSGTDGNPTIFPHVPTPHRQQRIGVVEKKMSNCMVLEAEMKFCSAVEAQHVLDRLEGLAASHVKRALLTIDAVELRENSGSLNERLALAEPPNAPTLPDAKVKAYYILRLLAIRQCKHRMVEFLNYFRAIEAHILLDCDESMANVRDTPPPVESSPAAAAPPERHYDRLDEANDMRMVDHADRPFVYSTAWDDLIDIEQDMLSIGSAVASFDERETLKAGAERKVVAVVDRFNVLRDLYECESWFLEAKFKLVRRLFDDVYMHAYGREAQRQVAQDLLDLVAERPMVDLTERYFWDAYVSQVIATEIQTKSLAGVLAGVDASLEDMLFSTAEAAVVVRTSTRQAIAAMDTSMPHLTTIERLSMRRAVHEQAVVCWHIVVTEEREYVTASSSIHAAVFANYYAKDSGVGTLIEQAANDVYRRHIQSHPLPNEESLDDQVHHLGTAYVQVLSRAVWFFKLQCELGQHLYATGLLEQLHASHMQQLFADDGCPVVPMGRTKPASSVLDQSPAIEALSFVSVLRTSSTLDWIAQHLTEAQLEWLTLTVHVQESERAFLEETLRFNAMLLEPILDFQASHPKLTAKHVAKFLSSATIDQNHKNFLAQVQSVLGQRTLYDKVTTRIQVELKTTSALCLHAENHRQSIRAVVASRVDMHPDTPPTNLVAEYMADLLESVQIEGLLTQLNTHLEAMRVVSRDLPASTINPFVVGGFSDRDTLESWLLRELSPMEEQLSVAPTVAVDGVKMAKGESTYSLWCGAQGDIVSMQYIPHPHELLKRFAKTDVANGRVVFRLVRDLERDVRQILALYHSLASVVDALVFRAALHRPGSDEVLGGELRDMLHQLHHDCFSRLNDPASAHGTHHVNDVMLEWLQVKREFLHTLRATALKAVVNDILMASAAAAPPSRLLSFQYLIDEGMEIVGSSSVADARLGRALVLDDTTCEGPATTRFVTGLSTADCTAARQVWKLLETRAGPTGGITYLKKFDAFHALRTYFFQIPVVKEASHVDKAVELQAILATEAVTKEAMTSSGATHRNSMPPSVELQVPDPGDLDHMIDNLRNRIELHLVDQDIANVRSLFASLLKSLSESPSPRRQAIVAGQAKLDTVGIFVTRVQEAVEAAVASNECFGSDVATLCRTFVEATQEGANFRQVATTALNVQLRHRIATLEDTTARLDTQRRRQEALADQVLATSVIIFELEEARHAIDMAGEELDVEKAKIISQIRSEYDGKLRDLNLELIQKHGQFEEYRAAVQNDLRVQLHEVQKSSVGKFIETGIPMQIKSQLVRSMRTNLKMEKIMEENTALKQTLMKLRTMYDLKDSATQAAHDQAEATLSAQLAKASLVFQQKNQVDAQLHATQTQLIALQKDLLRAQSASTSSTSTATSAIHKEYQEAAVKRTLHVTKFASRLIARQKAKAIVAKAVGDPVDGIDDDDGSGGDNSAEDDSHPQRRQSTSPCHTDNSAATRDHYIRSAHHLNREIRRLQKQLAKEVKAKTAALEQLHAARGHSHVLLEHENAKLHTELADTQRRYVAAVQEIGELQHLIHPEPCGHMSARNMAATAAATTSLRPPPTSPFPSLPVQPDRAAVLRRPRTSLPSRPHTSFVRPMTSSGANPARKLKAVASVTASDSGGVNATSAPNNNNEDDRCATTKRPKSAAAAPKTTPRKYDVVLRQDEDLQQQPHVEGTTHQLAARTRPLYR